MKRYLIAATPYLDDEGKQYMPPRYVAAMAHIGADIETLFYETPIDSIPGILDRVDGVLMTGGVDVDPHLYGEEIEPACGKINPSRDALEYPLIRQAVERKMPVMGICRGIQVINTALGGTLIQDIPTRYGTVHQMTGKEGSVFLHDVRVVPGTMLYDVFGGDIAVDSYHHQCIKRLADCLIPSAYSPEGFVEACELPQADGFLMAVQWHPEVSFNDDIYSQLLFERYAVALDAYRVVRGR